MISMFVYKKGPRERTQ